MNKYKVLEVGQVYKSYRQVAEALGEGIKTGNARNAQVKEWDCHFKYSKDGNKFIIEEVYDEAKHKVDMRKDGLNKVKYIEYIERLILDLLLNAQGNHLIISKNKLYQELKMVNKSYSSYKNDKKTFCTTLNITKRELDDFYLSSDSMLKRNLETALSNLANKALIDYPLVMSVGIMDSKENRKLYKRLNIEMTERENEYGDIAREFEMARTTLTRTDRLATPEERSIINSKMREAFFKLECKDIAEVYRKGKSHEFYKMVNKELFESLNIVSFYYSYDITFTKEDVINELEYLNNVDRILMEATLNDDIKHQINNNIYNKHRLASKRFEETGDSKYKMRMDKKYVQNGKTMVNALINTVNNADTTTN